MKNHAFLIPVHNQPGLLERIVSNIWAPNHYFIINVDAKCNNQDEFRSLLRRYSNVFFVNPGVSVYHGGISQVIATLAMFDTMFSSSNIRFDYVHQISGQDYPLRSVQQFDDFFDNTDESFMCFTYGKNIDLSRRERYVNGWHLNNSNTLLGKISNRLRIDLLIGRTFRRRDIGTWEGVTLNGGWDWWSWSEPVYSYVLDFLKHNPDYLKRFNHTHAPCEIIFHSILDQHTEDLKIRRHYPLRFVSWEAHRTVDSNYRPYILNEQDYQFVINSPCFFCRKVDEEQSRVLLDMIDRQRGAPFDISNFTSFV